MLTFLIVTRYSLCLAMLLYGYKNLLTFPKFPFQLVHFEIFYKKLSNQRMFSVKKLSNGTTLRPMKNTDIGQIIRLRRELTFQESISSYEICLQVDPEAFIIAADKNDRVVGLGCIRNFSDTVSVTGYLAIHPDYQNLGIANAMFKQHFPRGGKRNILSMAESDLISFNLQYYPVIEKEYMVIDYETGEYVNAKNLSSGNENITDVKRFQKENLAVVLEYDLKVIGFNRKEDVILNCLDPYGITVVAINNRKCIGYGSIKLNIQGAVKVGPLYAENSLVAEALLKKLLDTFAYGKGFATSVPSNNLEAIKLFGKLGKMKTVNNIRLYSRNRLALDTSPVYAMFDAEMHPF